MIQAYSINLPHNTASLFKNGREKSSLYYICCKAEGKSFLPSPERKHTVSLDLTFSAYEFKIMLP